MRQGEPAGANRSAWAQVDGSRRRRRRDVGTLPRASRGRIVYVLRRGAGLHLAAEFLEREPEPAGDRPVVGTEHMVAVGELHQAKHAHVAAAAYRTRPLDSATA